VIDPQRGSPLTRVKLPRAGDGAAGRWRYIQPFRLKPRYSVPQIPNIRPSAAG